MKPGAVRRISLFAATAVVTAVAALRTAPNDPAPRRPLPRPRPEAAQLPPAPPAPAPEVRTEPAGRPRPTDRIRSQFQSPNRGEQVRALKALESIADPVGKLVVLRDVMEGLDPNLKSRALLLLKGLPGPEAAALAVGVLQGAGPSWLRAQAANVLGEIGDAGSLPALLDASRTDDLDVRAGAATSLDRFGVSAPLLALITDLSGMTQHSDGGKREDAVLLLSTLQTEAVIPALARALSDPTNSRIREAAADALGRTRGAEVVPLLEAALQDPEPRVRESARQGLARARHN